MSWRPAAAPSCLWYGVASPSQEVSPDTHQQLLAAILHHDDGWREWDAAGEFDQEHGRPRSFTEMPLEQSLVIWTRSIEVAAEIGPLAAWVVAEHFSVLLANSSDARIPLAIAWLEAQRRAQSVWRERVGSSSPGDDPLALTSLLERAVTLLRYFDAFSLWLCGAFTDQGVFEPAAMVAGLAASRRLPADLDVKCRRRGDPLAQRITIEPWPFSTERLALETPACLLPLDVGSVGDKILTAGQGVSVCWSLCRDENPESAAGTRRHS